MKKLLSIVLAATLAFSLTACGGANNTGGTAENTNSAVPDTAEEQTPADTPDSGDVIKVGILTELSSVQTFSWPFAEVSNYMALNRVNENGGINGKRVEFELYDAQMDASIATQRLSEMKANGCVGCIFSSVGAIVPAVAEWAGKNQFPVLHNMNTATAATIEAHSDYMFNCGINAWGMAKVLAKEAVEKRGKESFVYIGVDEACTLDAERFLLREGQKYNPDFKEISTYRVGWEDSEFATIISTVLSLDPTPDFILQQGGGTDFDNLVQQGNMYGIWDQMDMYNDRCVDTASCQDLAASQSYPYGNVLGFNVLQWWSDDPDTVAWVQEWRDTAAERGYDETVQPGDVSFCVYGAATALFEGIRACDDAGADYTDSAVLTSYIADVTWTDFLGDHHFRDFDNQLTFDAVFCDTQDGGEEYNHLPIGVNMVKYTADEYLPTFEEMDAYAKEIGYENWQD